MKKYFIGMVVLLGFLSLSAQDKSNLSWWNDQVFYEVFVRSFYDSDGDGVGDFKGLTEKLDYLNDGDPTTDTDLGITALWLMPINPSPSYHGYDVTDYTGVNADYGTMDDFKAFLKAAHDRGIKVIIDFVMNHTSSQHPWFLDSRTGPTAAKRDWYRWTADQPTYLGPWGQQVWYSYSDYYYYAVFWDGMPDLNYNNADTKTAMFDAAKFWIDEMGIDGFRLDAAIYIFEDGSQLLNVPATYDFFHDFSAHIKSFNADAMTVGEAWEASDLVVPYVTNDRIDFCFEFDLATTMLNAANSGNTSGIVNALRDKINMYPYYQFGTFLTNHDQNRLMDVLGDDENKVKTAASIYLTIPGIPFLYYGEEVGLTGSGADENKRLPMQWTGGRNAGFTSGTPWKNQGTNYQTNNVETMSADESSLWSHYRNLIHARTEYDALRTGDFIELTSDNAAILSFLRKSDNNQRVVVLVNPSSSTKFLNVDFADYAVAGDLPPFDLMTSAVIGTSSSTGDIENIKLDPYQTALIVFDKKEVILDAPSISKELTFYPNPAHDFIHFSQSDDGSFSIYALDGRLVKSGTLQDQITVSDLKSGIYTIRVQTKDNQITKKLMISN